MDNILSEHVIELFEKKDFKNKLIKNLNKNVDIPFINEKTEKKVLDKLYDTLLESLKELEKE